MHQVTRWLWAATSIALGIYFLLTIWLGIVGLTHPYQLDYGEGIVLWLTKEIARGHPIYKSMDGFPYVSSNYPPLAMLLSIPGMAVLGEGYVSGRLLNFASALIVAALIYLIVLRDSPPRASSMIQASRASPALHSRNAALVAALFFLGSTYIYHWIPLYRVDLIGLALAMGGVYCVWLWQRKEVETGRSHHGGSFQLLLSALVLFLLSLYTKHTLIAAPAAAILALFRRQSRAAILFALALGASGGAIYLLLDLVTRGGFTFGLVESNATLFLPSQLIELLSMYAVTHAVLISLGMWEWLHRVRGGQLGVLEAYALTATLTLLFAGRVGAWENYFFEAIAITCVMAGFKVKDLSSRLDMQAANSNFVLPLLLLLQLGLYARDHDPRVAANLVTEDLPANQQLDAVLAQTEGVVISEDMGALVTIGKPVAYYTFQYSSLARAGKWDQNWELEGLATGRFPLVILERGTREDVDRYRRFTREFLSVLDRHYTRTGTIGKFELYAPAPPIQLQSAEFGAKIDMIGWFLETDTLSTGELRLAIIWQARQPLPSRYTAFVHLERTDGEKIAQEDREPRTGSYPTTRWAKGEIVREVYPLVVPGGLPAGAYRLRVGWYQTETGERLEVDGSEDNAAIIAPFAVK